MLLYELTSPVEHKYGGTLTEEQIARCTRQTELDSPRWAPYAFRQPHVENLCGKFVVRVARAGESTAMEPGRGLGVTEEEVQSLLALGSSAHSGAGSGGSAEPGDYINRVNCINHIETPIYTSCLNNQRVPVDHRLSSVCFKTNSPFGRQQELFHLEGHVTVRCTPGLPRSMIFKGVKGVKSIANLTRDLFLDEVGSQSNIPNIPIDRILPLVHMGVVSSCMGMRLQTSQCCYLENRVLEGPLSRWMAVEARTPDQCNIVRLSVTDWSGLLPARIVPSGNDLVITGKGSVVHRLSWTGLPWDDDVETELLSACERVVEAISNVC